MAIAVSRTRRTLDARCVVGRRVRHRRRLARRSVERKRDVGRVLSRHGFMFGRRRLGQYGVNSSAANAPLLLLLALAGLGLFAAIYHPIGIPLVIRNSGANQGKALALNGVFGSFGAAMAGVVTGFLADAGGSFLAFVLPGIVVTATGIVMLVGLLRERKPDSDAAPSADEKSAGAVGWRTPFLVLLFCLTASGLIYHATQTVMPKAFSLRLAADLKTVGFYVALVYVAGGLFQFVGGFLADRFPLKWVYLWQFVAHALLLLAAAYAGGMALVFVLCAAVALGAGALPAENLLLARHTPSNHHGLIFGLKFVLFFGSAPLGVLLVASVNRLSGEFVWVFLFLFVTAAIICAAALALPRRTPGDFVPVTPPPLIQ